MKPSLRAVFALSGLALWAGACVGGDAATGVHGTDSAAEIALQPAFIPSAADGSAAPIDRIRAVTTRVPDDVVLDVTVQDVSRTAPSWELVLSIRPAEGQTVVVSLYLLNVADDGTESVQFSGRTDPITLTVGEMARPDVAIVRGPIANLLVTGVTITPAPTAMVVGATQELSAEVTTSESAQPTLFWTSLDPTVVATSGSAVTALAPGTARVVASAGAFSDTASITVRGPLAITTASLPSGRVGTLYGAPLVASGGDGNYTWSIVTGSLPTGLSLNPATGQISGTPSAAASATVTIGVASGDGQTATRQLTVTVYAVLAITTATLPAAVENTAYSATLAASGGNGSYTWAVTTGSLPPGLSLNGTSGAITGVPTTGGTYPFTVTVTSGDAQTAQQALSISVVPAGVGQIVGVVLDAVTSEVIASASVVLSGGTVSRETSTDGSGAYSFTAIPAGTYVVLASADGYVENTAANLEVVAVGSDVVRADFALPPLGSLQRFAGLSGRVTDLQGNPLAGASVGISGGAQTNGVFRSTTTDADGTYALVGIVLDDAQGAPIDQFTVFATAAGRQVAQTPIALIQNETVPNVDFALGPSQGVQVFYSDGFEARLDWEASGFWNRSTLAGVVNEAVPTYVALAPGDGSNGALPAPIQGEYALWYGEPSTGNFMGLQDPQDAPGSGGTSLESNQGSVTSPPFAVPANAPTATLRFDTWFEIESVNPNASGFDIMTIGVFDESTGSYTELERLNPFVDPTFEPRDAIPFTSGGFNTKPAWRPEFVDLSAYLGKTISVVFTFSSEDQLYNGFRGWLIDNVSVSDVAVPFGAPPLAPPGSGSPTRTRGGR